MKNRDLTLDLHVSLKENQVIRHQHKTSTISTCFGCNSNPQSVPATLGYEPRLSLMGSSNPMVLSVNDVTPNFLCNFLRAITRDQNGVSRKANGGKY